MLESPPALICAAYHCETVVLWRIGRQKGHSQEQRESSDSSVITSEEDAVLYLSNMPLVLLMENDGGIKRLKQHLPLSQPKL